MCRIDSQLKHIFRKGREPSMGGLDNPLETMLYYLTLKFLSGFLYFPNNLNNIKGHI